MKKIFLILVMSLTVIGMMSCSAKAVKDNWAESMFAPDTMVYKSLGKTLSEILFSPAKVNVYSLKSVETIGKDDVVIEDHFVRDTLITSMNVKQIAVLQYLLLGNKDNYQNDSIQIRAPYLPQLEFEFIKKKGLTAHVVVSVNDRTWTVLYDDKVQFNWNYAHKKLIARFCDYFIERGKREEDKK